MSLQARCPGCGGEVSWSRDSSVVVVCPYCSAVVARGDRTLEQLGKVADLVDTGSPLQVGLKGRYHNVEFELTGRAQMQHPLGGVWDEWYAAFADGRWGWLAEAQGRYYLTFQQAPTQWPAFEDIQVGSMGDWVVAEKGIARAVSARGEIPFRLTPGAEWGYADLSGPNGIFGTVDYSESPPLWFAGREVTLSELGLAAAPLQHGEARQIKGLELRCPNCGGPLELRAPDRSKRVACPSCSALLDCSQGKLAFLQALEGPKVKPVLPIGATGDLSGQSFTVIGYLLRSVEYEGQRYDWDEYLLWESHTGFRWLVCSDGHWSFVEPVPPGDVHASGRWATLKDKQRFRLFQDGNARVDWVLGELYWEVHAGETVYTADYIQPPLMLSQEKSDSEINWSLGRYLEPREVKQAFQVKHLPPRVGVGANQPYPHRGVFKVWRWLLLVCFFGGCVLTAAHRPKRVYSNVFTLAPVANKDATQIVFSEPFQLYGHTNVRVKLQAPVSNSWAYVEGDLVEQSTGLVQSFSSPIEYYFGYDSDGKWTEGDANPEVYLSALPAGTYTLRLEAQWKDFTQPMTLTVAVDQNVPHWAHLWLLLLGISILPVWLLFRWASFGSKRWSQSDYNPYQSSSR